MPLQGKYEVKLGCSFLEPPQMSFMTMRCDFLPASVDRNQTGRIKISNEKEVGVRLPNINGAEPSSTLLKGHMRPVQKECLLVYNKRTGDLTLERISRAIQLKTTRDDPVCKKIDLNVVEQPPFQSNSSTFPRNRPKTMSESSSDDGDLEPSSHHANLTSKSKKPSPTQPRSPIIANPSTAASKPSTLSSGSDSDSDSSVDDPHRPIQRASPDRSSLSSLSSLDSTFSPPAKKTCSPPKLPTSSAPNTTAIASSFSIDRNIVENDLHLSETDSDEG